MNKVGVVAGERVAANVAVKKNAIAEHERPKDREADAEQDCAGGNQFAPRTGRGRNYFVILGFVSHKGMLPAEGPVIAKSVSGLVGLELLANGKSAGFVAFGGGELHRALGRAHGFRKSAGFGVGGGQGG